MERYRDIIPEFDLFKKIIHTPQPYDIRVNTLKSNVSEIKNILRQNGKVFEQRKWNDNFLKSVLNQEKTFCTGLVNIMYRNMYQVYPLLL